MTMRSPIAPERIGSVESISYYRDSKFFNGDTLFAGTPQDLVFFHGSVESGGLTNDLGKVGQLPQSASAWLRQVMLAPFSTEYNIVGDAQAKALRLLQHLPYFLTAEIHVADILVARGPLAAYGAPGPVVQGTSDPAGGASGAQIVSNAMSGLPMMDHPIHSRNTIRVRVSAAQQIPNDLRVVDGGSGSKIGIHCMIGVAQATAIAGQKDN